MTIGRAARPVLAFLLLLPVASACIGESTSPSVGETFLPELTLAENIDAFVRARVQDDFPGVAIRVERDGAVVFNSAYGRLRRDQPEPATTDTPFYVAQLAIPFTAVAVLMLYEDGLLDLEAKVEDVLPDIPTSWNLITIHHLLSHQSGLADYFTDLELGEAGLTNEVALAAIKEAPLTSMAGVGFRFSHSDYLVLAEVVEEVSGQPFQVFVQENVFDPLGMDRSIVIDESGPEVPGRAVGYVNLTEIGDYEVRTMGDGGIYVSLEDMGTWLGALESHALLSAETTALLYAPQADEEYGYGWYITDLMGRTAYYQEGLHRGFRAFVGQVPGADLKVTLLASGAYAWAFDLPGLIVLQVLEG